jgi:hypothetical protein
MRFICVDDGVPDITVRLLREACLARGVDFVAVEAGGFDFAADMGLEPGAMLYRPAVSARAALVEQYLWHDRVTTFHADPLGPFASTEAYPLLFAQAGLSVPLSLPVVSAEPDVLARAVAAVGGLPAIVKLFGHEGGTGVMRADSLEGLVSLADFLLAEGRQPWLCAYIAGAVHWRAVVVGERMVASYRNPVRPGDFRSFGSDDPADVLVTPPPGLAPLAVAAVKALRLTFGGVDVLAHSSGRLYLLEANFPCYFAHAQVIAGIDIAGAMLEHLARRARATGGS